MNTYTKLLVWFACGLFFYPFNLLAAPEVTCPLTDSNQIPEKVQFASTDPGHTQLVGYLFMPFTKVDPATTVPKTFPAIVMLHGRRGPYSKRTIDENGPYDEYHLSQRHYCWGRYWAEQGYLALHVDSFQPRGYPNGFDKGSHCSRPEAVNERTVRPYDAYGALYYLRGRPDVSKYRIGIQGWSNGGSTVMNTLSKVNVGLKDPDTKSGFQAGLAFYPGCRIKSDTKCECKDKANCSALHMEKNWKSYAPLLLFVATEDDEVEPQFCRKRLKQIKCTNNESVCFYDETGATHDFDDPENWKPHKSGSKPECKKNSADHPHRWDNCKATESAKERVTEFFAQHLKK